MRRTLVLAAAAAAVLTAVTWLVLLVQHATATLTVTAGTLLGGLWAVGAGHTNRRRRRR
jgi:hypothetical protein